MTAPIPSQVAASNFWAKVEAGDCWEWTGSRSSEGYGLFSIGKRSHGAHRIAYELLVGPIPSGLHVDHLCRNRACVNPDHLEPVTCRVNLMRGVGPTAQNARKTHCTHGHEFTPENTRRDKQGRRICATCRPLSTRQPLTHCKRGHERTEENVYVYGRGRIQCRPCQAFNDRARRAALRSAAAVAEGAQ